MIVIALLNTLLLLVFNRIFPDNSKGGKWYFSFQTGKGLAFINILACDFLASVILVNLLLLFNMQESSALWIVGGAHAVLDIFIVTGYVRCSGKSAGC